MLVAFCFLLLLFSDVELLKVFFSVLEDADVLLESDSLTQLKAEYNIAGSARYPITRNAREAAKARRDDLWARYPWLQVRSVPVVCHCHCCNTWMCVATRTEC